MTKNTQEVTCCIKWLLFVFNMLVWLTGCVLLSAGIWAWTEKDMFSNIGSLTGVPVDPALALILIGGIMFVIGFCGCLGALRESRGLLLVFMVLIGIILLIELTVGILVAVYRSWLEEQLTEKTKVMIVKYRDDPDLQNMIDWVQSEWLYCCGVSSYSDWETNVYFNCTSPGAEACGVPYSCCQPTEDGIQDTQCGYDMLKTTTDILDVRDSTIYTVGCIDAGKTWINKHMVPVIAVSITLAVLQIIGIALGCKMRSDIEECENHYA